MEIVVRKADGYVLNSSIFNFDFDYQNQLNNGIDYNIYEQEYYDVYDVEIPNDESIDGFIKQYFYIDGELVCKYSATEKLDAILKQKEDRLASTDYIIVKAYESNLLGELASDQYDYEKIAQDRQALRDEINRLRDLKAANPTIETYKPEYLKPVTEEQNDKE